MNENYFSMDRLSVGYHNKTLIHDICVDIKKGEIVTLIGPNGAGKSTILKSISKQLELIRGRVFLDGNDLAVMSYRDLSQKMAVVLTERLKTELLTCYDIVATGRYPYIGRFGILSREDEEKVDDALRQVNAYDLGPCDFNEISDGQKQRIMLARAICQDPEIILLDEPTSFLDIRYKLDLLSILRRMAKEKGITIIMTLHEIDLAEKVSDKIVCVHGETIFDYGTPEEIFTEEKIRRLYDIDNGFFDPILGSIELQKPTGEPQVFVISSGGSGIRTFRELQKEDIPFAAGILYENDIDYLLARYLAADVVTEKPFCEISDDAYHRAADWIRKLPRVIDTGVPIEGINRRLGDLIDLAREQGKLELVRESEQPTK
ncbi:MAG: ABC transporter ATP-binding protein [Anaerovoracaceae bacterium]|jgi:iron complex transport system ATP-binding protein